jgi:hypothetical protein
VNLKLFILGLLVSTVGYSQSGNYLKIDPTKPIRVDYNSASWNKNPNAVDSAALLFRDSGSNRIAKIEI